MIVGYRDQDGAWERMGIQWLGGAAVFESNCPYDHDEQVLASMLMLGHTDETIVEKLKWTEQMVVDRTAALLEKAGTGPSGLLYAFLTSPEPAMCIERLMQVKRCDFSQKQMALINLLVCGRSITEMAQALQVTPGAIDQMVQRIARAMDLPPSYELLATALVLSDQAGMVVPARSFLRPPPTPSNIQLGPNPEVIDKDSEWGRAGIRLFDGVALFEWRNTLTPRQCQIASFAILGFSNGEISRSLHISEDTTKTHLRRIMKVAKARGREQILPGLLTANPPLMRVERQISPGTLPFTRRQLHVGRFMLRHTRADKIAEAMNVSIDKVKYDIQTAPAGLQGRAQMLAGMILGGRLDRELAVLALERQASAEEPLDK